MKKNKQLIKVYSKKLGMYITLPEGATGVKIYGAGEKLIENISIFKEEEVTPFHKTIIHQEVEKWLEKPEDGRSTITQDDGKSFVIETGENKFVLVKVTNELLDSVVIKIIDHDLSVGNEDTSQCTE